MLSTQQIKEQIEKLKNLEIATDTVESLADLKIDNTCKIELTHPSSDTGVILPLTTELKDYIQTYYEQEQAKLNKEVTNFYNRLNPET